MNLVTGDEGKKWRNIVQPGLLSHFNTPNSQSWHYLDESAIDVDNYINTGHIVKKLMRSKIWTIFSTNNHEEKAWIILTQIHPNSKVYFHVAIFLIYSSFFLQMKYTLW